MCVKCCLFKVTFTRGRGMFGFDPPTCEPRRVSGMSLAELQEMATVQPSSWWVPDPQTHSQGRQGRPQAPQRICGVPVQISAFHSQVSPQLLHVCWVEFTRFCQGRDIT